MKNLHNYRTYLKNLIKEMHMFPELLISFQAQFTMFMVVASVRMVVNLHRVENSTSESVP